MKFCQVDDNNVARTEAQLARFYGVGKGRLCADSRGFSSAKGFDEKCRHLRWCIIDNDPRTAEFCLMVPKRGLSLMQRLWGILTLLERISHGDILSVLETWRGMDPNIQKIITDQVISKDDIEIANHVRNVLQQYMDAIVSMEICPKNPADVRKQWFEIMQDTVEVALKIYARILPSLSQAYILHNVPGLKDYTTEMKHIASAEKFLNGEEKGRRTKVDEIIKGIANDYVEDVR